MPAPAAPPRNPNPTRPPPPRFCPPPVPASAAASEHIAAVPCLGRKRRGDEEDPLVDPHPPVLPAHPGEHGLVRDRARAAVLRSSGETAAW